MLMRQLDGWTAKGGAEGLLCACGPAGVGIALKVEDGSMRAMRPALAELLRQLGFDGRSRRRAGGRARAARSSARSSSSGEERVKDWTSHACTIHALDYRADGQSRGRGATGLLVCLGRSLWQVAAPVHPREESGGHVLTVDILLPEVEELQKLVQHGQEKGFLTYDEIIAARLEEVDLTKEQIEALHLPDRPLDRARRGRAVQRHHGVRMACSPCRPRSAVWSGPQTQSPDRAQIVQRRVLDHPTLC